MSENNRGFVLDDSELLVNPYTGKKLKEFPAPINVSRKELTAAISDVLSDSMKQNGGEGSGNFGHEGRPGEVGGSQPDNESGRVPDYYVDSSDANFEIAMSNPVWFVTKNKTPSSEIHPKISDNGVWGDSHGNSTGITGESADQMGIAGYDRDELNGKLFNKISTKMLTSISDDNTGSEEMLFHGFENTRDVNFEVGDTFKLPLTATSGEPGHAVSYGFRSDIEDQRGMPTLFVFSKGTPMAAYGIWKKSEAKEFGYNYTEAIVAGEFRVTKVYEAIYPYAYLHSRRLRKSFYAKARIVELDNIGVYDIYTGEWRSK